MTNDLSNWIREVIVMKKDIRNSEDELSFRKYEIAQNEEELNKKKKKANYMIEKFKINLPKEI